VGSEVQQDAEADEVKQDMDEIWGTGIMKGRYTRKTID